MPGGPPVWNCTACRSSVRWTSSPPFVSSARVVTSSRYCESGSRIGSSLDQRSAAVSSPSCARAPGVLRVGIGARRPADLEQRRLDVEAPAERDRVDRLGSDPQRLRARHAEVDRDLLRPRPCPQRDPVEAGHLDRHRHLRGRLRQGDEQDPRLRRAVGRRPPAQPDPPASADVADLQVALAAERRALPAPTAAAASPDLQVAPVDARAPRRRRHHARPGRLGLEERVGPAARGRARERERRAGEELEARAGAAGVRRPGAEDVAGDLNPVLAGMAAPPAPQG